MRKKALIVDDTKTESYFLHSLLEKAGFLADEATDCYDALSLITMRSYAVIFVDEHMPVNTGANTVSLLRNSLRSHRKETPIILLGENSSEIDGPAVLKKPVEYRRLTEELVKIGLLSPELYAKLMEELERDRKNEVQATVTDNSETADPGTGGSGEDAPITAEPESFEDEIIEIPPVDEITEIVPDSVPDHTPELPDWLYKSTDIDLASGIQFCGSEDGYYEALTIFYHSLPGKAEEIRSYMDTGDITSYTIKVHALKSSSLLIGATELSHFAADLEAAGKQEDKQTINRETPSLLQKLEYIHSLLAPLFEPPETARPPVPPEVLADAYASLKEFTEQMDVDLMEMVLDSMKEYELPPDDAQMMAEIDRFLFELDWNQILDLLENHHG